MVLSTEKMINTWVEFGEKASAVAPGFTRQYLHDFSQKLRAFNDDPSNEDSRPYFFIHRVKDTVSPVEESDLDLLLLKAQENGIDGLFEKVRHEDGAVVLYFGHQAVEFATSLCSDHGFGYANLGVNGLCVPGFAFRGLTSASAEQVKSSIVDAKVYLMTSVVTENE